MPIPVVHRGLVRIESDIARTWQQGQTITANKFWSTSKEESVAEGFRKRGRGDVILFIEHKTGEYVEAITKFKTQHECLITVGKNYRVDLIRSSPSNNSIREIFLTEL